MEQTFGEFRDSGPNSFINSKILFSTSVLTVIAFRSTYQAAGSNILFEIQYFCHRTFRENSIRRLKRTELYIHQIRLAFISNRSVRKDMLIIEMTDRNFGRGTSYCHIVMLRNLMSPTSMQYISVVKWRQTNPRNNNC